MAGPGGAAESILPPGDLDKRAEAGRVHLFVRRGKYRVCAASGAEVAVSGEGPRVLVEVLARSELRWIDKDRHDDETALGPSSLDQLRVAFVQSTHRRHEADALASSSCGNHRL